MVNCEICGKNFETSRQLACHLSTHKITSKEYYIKFIGHQGVCNVCKTPTNFISLTAGFCKHCSYECTKISSSTKNKRKKTCRKKFNSDHFFSSDVGKDKVKKGMINKHGHSNPMFVKKIKEKLSKNNMKKYGKSCVLQLESVKTKRRKTCTERYGQDHHLKNPEILKKQQKTVMEKYSVRNIALNREIIEKTKQTNIARYGNEYIYGSRHFKEKAIESFEKSLGVSNPMKLNEIRNKVLLKNRENMYNSILTGKRTDYQSIPLFSYDEFEGVHHQNKYKWYCKKCSTVFKDHMDDGHNPRCPICYPPLKGFSKMEKDIAEFVESLGIEIIENDRSILEDGKELDIYIPSHNLAIEFDGLYWHSETNGHKSRLYHLEKTEQCESKGIQLLHIFEDEWINKKPIIKSLIRSKLGVSSNRLYARKCDIVKLQFKDAREFLNEHHIQGPGTPSKICYGLSYDFQIVAVMTLSKPRYNKKYEYELVRYATKKNYSIVGGFSKLLKAFIREKTPKNLISYADRRYSNGNVYIQCGFNQIETSKPNYFYIEPTLVRSSRVKYQKHKLAAQLKTFDSNLTEWQNMQLNDYDRIWDCGNLVFDMMCE